MLNTNIHRRQSRRLNGYDYASEGLYFITINVKNRNPLFGEIKNGIMHLNETGSIAENCWMAIPQHFPHAALHEFVIMPDHVHGIIEIIYNPNAVSLPGAENFPPLQTSSKTIGSIIRGFKIGVTKYITQHTGIRDVWQRNYTTTSSAIPNPMPAFANTLLKILKTGITPNPNLRAIIHRIHDTNFPFHDNHQTFGN